MDEGGNPEGGIPGGIPAGVGEAAFLAGPDDGGSPEPQDTIQSKKI